MPLKKKRFSTVHNKPSVVPANTDGIIYQKFTDYISTFYGAAGVGKTSFVHGFSDRVLFISTDRGTRFLPLKGNCRQEVNSWADIVAVVEYLQKNTSQYDMVCLDHVDDIAYYAEEDICNTYDIESADELAHGKYWRDLKKKWRWVIHNIKRTGLGIVFIAHETTKEIKIRGRKINRTMPLIGKTTWKLILPLTDLLGYCYMEYDVQQKQDIRMLQTQPSDSVDAKDRTVRQKPDSGYEIMDSKHFMKTFVNIGGSNARKKESNKKENNTKESNTKKFSRRAR